MREALARRVVDELSGEGYETRLHEPADGNGAFEVSVRGHGFGLEDLKTLVRMSADLGVGLRLDDKGWLTLA
jgi:hypothetical protein